MLRRSAISILLIAIAVMPPVHARTRPHYGGALRVETAGDAWHGPDAVARRLVLDGLTELDASGAVSPALAVSWQAEDNGHRWQFRLRPGVHFQDGSPLTATAAMQSLNLACATNCPWTAVRAVGGSTLVFTSDSPLPNLPGLLASDGFLITLTQTADGQAPTYPTGTGPFQVVQSANNVVTLTANENCWQGRPFADQVTVISHRAIRDQWLDLTLGRTDVVEVPAEQLRQAQQQRLAVITSEPVSALVLQLSDSGTLANPMLRTAISYAIDRSSIFNVIFQKQGQVTASLLPMSLTGYAFLFPADRDLNKANQARGGLNPGTLTLMADGDGAMQLTAQRLVLNLREAGFNVRFVSAGNPRIADLFLRGLPVAGADAAGALGRLLLSAGQPPAVAGDDPQALFRMEQDLLDQHLLVPLLDLPRAYAIGGRVKNFALRGDGIADLAGVSLENAP